MEKGRTFETVVGLFVLIVTVVFSNYVYVKSGWQTSSGCVFSAKFDKADGLSEGTDVKISGIRVGKIINMTLDPQNFMAVIKFNVVGDVKLPKDTSASVQSDGLFGGKYLSLSPGGEDENLKDGDMIENTSGPLNLETLIGKFLFSKDSAKTKSDD
jgi:phospholipid/cholesterol/gamma-HCH transport system substrate-binding protein